MNQLWIMDRGIPTEESLEQMRSEGASYLVGTPRGRLSKLETQLIGPSWRAVTSESFTFRLNRKKLRKARRGEGTYLLRTNLKTNQPEELWKQTIVLTEVK